MDELTGKRTFGTGEAAEGITFRSAQVVGQYAIQIEFSDGHGTGLYSFDLLRRICPCAACAGAETAR